MCIIAIVLTFFAIPCETTENSIVVFSVEFYFELQYSGDLKRNALPQRQLKLA